MPPRTKLTKAHKDGIRLAALARHAARRDAGLPLPSGQPYATPAPTAVLPNAVIDAVTNHLLSTATSIASIASAATSAAPAAAFVRRPSSPLVVFRDDGTIVPPKVVPETPRPLPDPAPRTTFQEWLKTAGGRAASDPRMSSSSARFGAELEHSLWQAWQAGRDSNPPTPAES